MIKRKLLGQHFLNSKEVANTIVSAAKIRKKDTVLEIGTGLGILTPLLCHKAGKVISIEKDAQLYEDSKSKLSDIKNLELRFGDGFRNNDEFSVFVSNLPYSKSKKTIEWLAEKSFSHGMIMIQKEFAEKLFATSQQRRAISIIANYAFEMKQILKVGKNNFSPPPKIDSIVLSLIKKQDLSKELISTVNKIFSYKRKTIQNISKQFGKEIKIDKRLEDLTEDEIIEFAKKLIK